MSAGGKSTLAANTDVDSVFILHYTPHRKYRNFIPHCADVETGPQRNRKSWPWSCGEDVAKLDFKVLYRLSGPLSGSPAPSSPSHLVCYLILLKFHSERRDTSPASYFPRYCLSSTCIFNCIVISGLLIYLPDFSVSVFPSLFYIANSATFLKQILR